MNINATQEIKYANDYYYNYIEENSNIEPPQYDEISKLELLIDKNDIQGLSNCHFIKKYGINYGFGSQRNTLMHIAYTFNRPEVVDWLIKNGASEYTCNKSGIVPLAWAHKEYKDPRPRVINEITNQYLKKCNSQNPHILFDIILNFIREKKWSYCDTQLCTKIKTSPFRDDKKVIILGLPNLSYKINCFDLSNLFLTAAKIVGIDAKEIIYNTYLSISPDEKNDKNIIGEFRMFDESGLAPFSFDSHSLIFSNGFYFDLTLMCKYTNEDQVLKNNLQSSIK